MYNKVVLIGRITANPELKVTPNGVSVVSFSLAVGRPFVPKGGERQTDFINITAWRATADFVCKFFEKGRLMLVEGSLQSRNYVDNNGNKRIAFEVVADNIHFVDSKNNSAGNSSTFDAPPPPVAAPPVPYSSGDLGDFEEVQTDDDLPF